MLTQLNERSPPWLTPTTWGMFFLFFAFFVYPWFFSYSVYALTINPVAKRKILPLIYVGIFYGFILFGGQLNVPDLGLDQCLLHIHYNTYFFGQRYLSHDVTKAIDYLGIVIYIFLTSAAFFMSDIRYKSFYGALAAGTAIICLFVYLNYYVSVWCFYAAVLAIFVAASTHCKR
jgi:hypothetical protein